MNTSYRFSSAQGDVTPDDAMLEQAFAIGPSDYHSFMTLRDFFDCIARFLMPQGGLSIAVILSGLWGRPVRDEEIEEIVIRYEKYGTLYQICSVDVSAGGSFARLCASMALSQEAKETLEREFELLRQFEKKRLRYLPRAYKKDLIEVEKAGGVERLLVVLLDWFDDYEEWHFKTHEGSTKAFLWDMRGGYRFLSEEQTLDTVRQASRILTLYYDVESTKRISPWHHGGGDFVVKTSDAAVDVKLVTARGYDPISSPDDERPVKTLCAFCIETITKMRLDKWEGMGESTWADRFVLEAALKGFFEGLEIKEARGEMGPLTATGVLQELKSSTAEELKRFVRRLLAEMKQYDLSDYGVVLRHLNGHAEEICTAIRSFAQ